jgi:hypothetical protein
LKLAEQELTRANGSSELSEFEKSEAALDPQLRLFCYEYLVDFDHRRAATVAKFNPDKGVRLLRRPEITQFIKLLTDELANESLISRDMVQHELIHEFLPRAKGDVDIVGVDRDGVAWKGKVTNMAAHAKAIDLMARHSGFTVPETVKGGLTININHKAMGITVDGESVEVTENEQSEQSAESG